MPTLGEELKQRREERGIELARIADATRIGQRFLLAIENNNFSVLPGGIFTRAFIRAYAREVGMSEDEAISRYYQQIKGQSGEHVAMPAAEQPRAAAASTGPLKAGAPAILSEPHTSSSGPGAATIAVAVVIIGLVVAGVVYMVNHMKKGTDSSSPVTSTAPLTQKTPPPAPSPQTTPEEKKMELAANQPINVKLEATTGESWISYQVDGSKPINTLLKPGQAQDLPPAQKEVKLTAGNRFTLKVRINNRDVTLPSSSPDEKNTVAKVTINRDNLQTFLK